VLELCAAYLLLTTYYLLPTTYYLLPTTYYLLQVLELCAAPGGKSTHLAEIMGDAGRVLSVEASEY
jgi:23S rRNA U2552 (ribose-2'-O)-methylase RlmE/FtsJ